LKTLKHAVFTLTSALILFSLTRCCGQNLAVDISKRTVFNVDGDLELDAFQDACFWHPHGAGGNIAEKMGGEWNIIFGDYATLVLEACNEKYGHVAARTWWLDWVESNFSKVPLNQTIIVSVMSALEPPTTLVRLGLR